MKTCTSLVLILTAVAVPNFLFSQTSKLHSVLQELVQKIQAVEAKKYSYEVIKTCKGQNECMASNKNASALMSTIAKDIESVSFPSDSYEQRLSPVSDSPGQWEYIRIENKSKKSKEESYVFNLSDLNAKSIEYKIGKENIEIIISTKRKEEIIKYFEDQEPSDYKKEMKWLCNDVALMRKIICALEDVVTKMEEK